MADRPNIFIIVSDDHRWCDAGCYGSPDVHMPNLGRLAREGMRFDRAYTPAPICAPSRMSLYTGLYPVRSGGWPNHSRVYDGTRSVVHHLTGLGYRVGLHGKRHIRPPEAFPFEGVEDIAEFLSRDPKSPYCLVFGTKEPHTPWGELDAERYDPSHLRLSPNFCDTPKTRLGYARYCSDLSRLDRKIGDCMGLVERTGGAGNTIFIYTTDHGAQFPGGKWTCYEPGLRVPFVLRWPDRVSRAAESGALIQHVDVLPTLIAAAGGDPASVDTGCRAAGSENRGFDGCSFLEVLLGRRSSHRDFVFGVSTQHGTVNGVPYAVRSVCERRWKYIVNLQHGTEFSNALIGRSSANGGDCYWGEWRAAAESDPRARFLVDRYLHRPPVELYDLRDDPWELRNLAESPDHGDAGSRLREVLEEWMRRQGDLGVKTEMGALERQR